MNAPRTPSPPGHLTEGPPGHYRWLYQVNLYRKPRFLFLIWRIFFFIWLGVSLFIFLISQGGQGLWESLKNLGPALLMTGLFIMALVAFAYYVYALLMKGRYTVLFTMDQKGIHHSQVKVEAQKAGKIAGLTTLAGLATGQASVAGAGLLAASHQSLYTPFKRVNAVKVKARQQTIKLRSSLLIHNQVYTQPQDFDFVLNFIKEQIPPTAKIR